MLLRHFGQTRNLLFWPSLYRIIIQSNKITFHWEPWFVLPMLYESKVSCMPQKNIYHPSLIWNFNASFSQVFDKEHGTKVFLILQIERNFFLGLVALLSGLALTQAIILDYNQPSQFNRWIMRNPSQGSYKAYYLLLNNCV